MGLCKKAQCTAAEKEEFRKEKQRFEETFLVKDNLGVAVSGQTVDAISNFKMD